MSQKQYAEKALALKNEAEARKVKYPGKGAASPTEETASVPGKQRRTSQPRGPPAADQRQRHHLDRRVDQILASDEAAGAADDLLSTYEVSRWLGVSTQWLEIGRSRQQYGPPYVRLATKVVRYRRSEVERWLLERSYRSTVEYA